MITFGYKSKSGGAVRAAIAIAMGVAMLFVGNAMDIVVYIIALFILISGLTSLFIGLKQDAADQRPLIIINSSFNLIVAALMFIFANQLGNLIIGIIGLLLVLFGLFQIVILGSLRRAAGTSAGFMTIPVVVLVCGALLLFHPDFIGNFVGVIIGVSFILYGLSELFSTWKMRQVISREPQEEPQRDTSLEDELDHIKDVDYEKVDEQ